MIPKILNACDKFFVSDVYCDRLHCRADGPHLVPNANVSVSEYPQLVIAACRSRLVFHERFLAALRISNALRMAALLVMI